MKPVPSLRMGSFQWGWSLFFLLLRSCWKIPATCTIVTSEARKSASFSYRWRSQPLLFFRPRISGFLFADIFIRKYWSDRETKDSGLIAGLVDYRNFRGWITGGLLTKGPLTLSNTHGGCRIKRDTMINSFNKLLVTSGYFTKWLILLFKKSYNYSCFQEYDILFWRYLTSINYCLSNKINIDFSSKAMNHRFLGLFGGKCNIAFP